MRSTGTLCRRGTSTILGTLIFIGIMFTAVIPMFLVMNQADTLYEMRKHELELLDNERLREDLYVYVFPIVDSSDLTLRVVNRGDFVAKIVKIWVNDYPHLEENFIVEPMGMNEKILDGVYFTPVIDEDYFVKVTTDMGRSIASDTPLTWLGEYTGWSTGETLAINVLISSLSGCVFKIKIYDGETLIVEGSTEKYDPKFFIGLSSDVLYTVKIFRGTNLLYMKGVTIIFPSGPPIVWVFV